jgi:hypothetical protein
MTTALAKVMAEANELPESEQDQLAWQIRAYLKSELKWDRQFSGSQAVLEKMAKRARDQKRKGRVLRKGFDEL